MGQAADVVIHSTSSALPKVMEQLLACLEAESCVVSTCEELSYPYRTYPELAAKLDAAAKDWGVALVGTGVNPGFVLDKLIVTLASVVQRIDHVSGRRIVDGAKRRRPLQKKIGAGCRSRNSAKKLQRGIIKHVGTARISSHGGGQLESARSMKLPKRSSPVVASERVQTEFLTRRGRPGRGSPSNRARTVGREGTDLS